jgi:NTP pyrophosphatase (non-canonical NTP hydrolase)
MHREAIIEQNNNRKRWAENDTPEALVGMLEHEAQELTEAIKESMVTGDVFSVASEIGDVGYLLYKLCDLMGIDLNQAIEMKIFRNSYKYADYVIGNERDYTSATSTAKEAWKALGGDKVWSHVYLDHLAHD